MTDPDELQLLRLIEADPLATSRPDLGALRAGGRQRLQRRRAAMAAGAVAVVVAVALPIAVLSGGDRPRSEGPVTPPSSVIDQSSPATPDAPPSKTPYRSKDADLPIPGGGRLNAELEQGEVLGDEVVVGKVFGYDQLLYATQFDTGEGPETYVAVGARAKDGRLVRFASVLNPNGVEEPDGIGLWNGYQDQEGDGSTYLLVGLAPGDVQVSIDAAGEEPRPVTEVRTSILPGYTVFYDVGQWRDNWDPNQPAPLTITTSDGAEIKIRDRTYVS